MDRGDLCVDVMRGERGADHLGLPLCDIRVRCVLQLAPAAGFEMPAGRRDAVRRRLNDADIAQGLAIRGARHHLARKGTRRVNGAVGDAVAVMTQPNDPVLGHSRSSRVNVKPEAIQRDSRSRSRWPSAGPV